MYEFGKAPDACFDIFFEKVNDLEHQLKILKEMETFQVPGVYIFHLKEGSFPRVIGESNVIRIGATNKGLCHRLRNYNGKRSVTILSQEGTVVRTGTVLRETYKWKGGTEAFLMSLLWNLSGQGKALAISFFKSSDPDWYESDFMLSYLEHHQELPPGNLRLEKIAARRSAHCK